MFWKATFLHDNIINATYTLDIKSAIVYTNTVQAKNCLKTKTNAIEIVFKATWRNNVPVLVYKNTVIYK